MRPQLLLALMLGACASAAHAFTVDELVAKNIEARGGLDAIRAIQSIKSSGRMNFSGGDFSIIGGRSDTLEAFGSRDQSG